MLRKLIRDEQGATVVEFGLLLPVILGGFLGVLQVGVATFYYNSLRNATAEASRKILTSYQKEDDEGYNATKMEDDLEDAATDIGLNTSSLTVKVVEADTQRIDGAIEMTLTMKYKVPSVVPFLGVNEFTETYSRPLFLIDNDA